MFDPCLIRILNPEDTLTATNPAQHVSHSLTLAKGSLSFGACAWANSGFQGHEGLKGPIPFGDRAAATATLASLARLVICPHSAASSAVLGASHEPPQPRTDGLER
jgi:hypothetical protein